MTYKLWADDYYGEGRHLQLVDVAGIYDHKPLTCEIVKSLNPERNLSDLAEEIREIGYST